MAIEYSSIPSTFVSEKAVRSRPELEAAIIYRNGLSPLNFEEVLAGWRMLAFFMSEIS